METSSISSHHYAALLQTISELRADLEKTAARIRSLEDQNESLNSNYSAVKEDLLETRRKYNEAREGYLNSVAEKFEAERQHTTFIEKLKLQLLERTREFEQIKEKLVPHDIDQLRIQVQEELQLQHKQDIKAKDIEAESLREKFYTIKRELERTKSEFAILLQHQQNEIDALHAEQQHSNIEPPSANFSTSGSNVTPLRKGFAVDEVCRQNELSHLVDKLRQELVHERSLKCQQQSSHDEERRDYDQVILNLKAKIASIEAERSGLLERNQRLQADLEKKDHALKTMKSQYDDATVHLDQVSKELQERERVLSACRAEFTLQTQQMREEHRAEIQEQQEAMDEVSQKLREREDHVRRLQREISDVQQRAESTENELRRAHLQQSQELRKKNNSLELELVDLKQLCREREEDALGLQEQLSIERDGLLSEASRLRREKEVMHIKMRENESLAEAQRKKLHSTQSDLVTKVSLLERQLRDVKANFSASEVRYEGTYARLQDLDRERRRLADLCTSLEARLVEEKKRRDNLHKEFQQQLEGLGPSFKERADEVQRQMKVAISKERKRADAYKLKALEAHSRVKSLSEVAFATT